MDIKGFAMDHMGHFAPHDIPNALFALSVAALLGLLVGWAGGRSPAVAARSLAGWAALAALVLVLVRGQLAVAVAVLGLLFLVRSLEAGPKGGLPLAMALVIGAGCGSGATLVTLVLALPLILLLRWASAPASAS